MHANCFSLRLILSSENRVFKHRDRMRDCDFDDVAINNYGTVASVVGVQVYVYVGARHGPVRARLPHGRAQAAEVARG